ncbi:MAG TPA: GDSL-type esterase/lipase family protein, partial [Burkholderiales bacterium]|nr:GDSL-type esterase/lipase family protein [Burkholderiales bacterium]
QEQLACPSVLRRLGLRLLLLIFAFSAVGCAKPPALEPLPADAVVLAFGDSLTYGTGAQEDESYPAQLGRIIGRPVVGAGVPGEVTARALARLPAALDEHAPALLLLCIGGNDFLRRLGTRQAEHNVRAMVKLARSRGIGVLLIGTPEPGFSVTPPPFYAAIAQEFGLPYEGEVIGEVLRDESLKADPIHPNARGYRLIAERLAAALKQSGAL